MKKLFKISISVALLIFMISAVASADMTLKTKTDMSGMMGMSSTNFSTYMIKANQIAFINETSAGMGGQNMNMKTKTIMRNGGNEMLVINYEDKTYSVIDKEKANEIIGGEMKDMMDSLKEMMTVNEFEFGMTGKTKEINGMKAEESSMLMDMVMSIQMQGPEPIPAHMKMTGTQWLTNDFKDADAFKKLSLAMTESFMGAGQSGMGSMKPFLEAMGISEAKMNEAMKMIGYIPVEGVMNIEMKMEMPGMSADMPGMTMNMKLTTSLVESSDANIPDSEFEIPEGFKESEEFTMPSGGMGFPGMGQ